MRFEIMVPRTATGTVAQFSGDGFVMLADDLLKLIVSSTERPASAQHVVAELPEFSRSMLATHLDVGDCAPGAVGEWGRADRELLAELARLNSDVVPLAIPTYPVPGADQPAGLP